MPPIAIVTDTDASLPLDLAAQRGISIVPIMIQFEDESLRADYDLADGPLFERISRDGRLPTTAAPSPGAFAEAFEAALSGSSGLGPAADEVICFCVSGAISATYAAAQTARSLVDSERITVVDTAAVSAVQAFMALCAAEDAAKGASRDEILAHAGSIFERSALYGALSTLRYLAMGGRVPHLTASMAQLLNIRPILTMRSGRLDLLEKVRSRKRAWERMVELSAAHLGQSGAERWALVYVNAREEALAFGEQLRAAVSLPAEPLVLPLGAGLAAHTGDGTIAVALVRA